LHNIFLSVEAGWRNLRTKKKLQQQCHPKKNFECARVAIDRIFFLRSAPVLCTERIIKINFYEGGTHNTY
jgi:hypothetical protein